MVGVLTNNRCDNCRQRKKKCDGQKPSCSECILGGWTCPGYKAQWKFIDETARLAKHYAGRKYVYDAIDLNLEEVYSKYACGLDRSVGRVAAEKNPLFIHYSDFTYSITYKSEIPRPCAHNGLSSAVVYCLDAPVQGTLVPLRLIGSYFEFIPARLGRNAALDDTVSCLCGIYCGSPSVPYHMQIELYKSYVRALSSLRSCLSNTSLQMEPETLCASILLQLCELGLNIGRGGWSQLARGTAGLLYSRGVHRYQSAFEQAMLESQLSFVIGQSIKFNEHCFLCSPEWRPLLFQTAVWPFQTLQPRSLSLRTQLSSILVDSPSLIIYYLAINENQIGQTTWEERAKLFVLKASKLLNDLKAWLTVEAELLFLSYDSAQGADEQVHYPDIIFGVLDCVANTALLVIDKILRSLCLSRLQASSGPGRSFQKQLQLQAKQLLEDPEIIERRRQRVKRAFEFVKEESEYAAKPLDFGLRVFTQ